MMRAPSPAYFNAYAHSDGIWVSKIEWFSRYDAAEARRSHVRVRPDQRPAYLIVLKPRTGTAPTKQGAVWS